MFELRCSEWSACAEFDTSRLISPPSAEGEGLSVSAYERDFVTSQQVWKPIMT